MRFCLHGRRLVFVRAMTKRQCLLVVMLWWCVFAAQAEETPEFTSRATDVEGVTEVYRGDKQVLHLDATGTDLVRSSIFWEGKEVAQATISPKSVNSGVREVRMVVSDDKVNVQFASRDSRTTEEVVLILDNRNSERDLKQVLDAFWIEEDGSLVPFTHDELQERRDIVSLGRGGSAFLDLFLRREESPKEAKVDWVKTLLDLKEGGETYLRMREVHLQEQAAEAEAEAATEAAPDSAPED